MQGESRMDFQGAPSPFYAQDQRQPASLTVRRGTQDAACQPQAGTMTTTTTTTASTCAQGTETTTGHLYQIEQQQQQQQQRAEASSGSSYNNGRRLQQQLQQQPHSKQLLSSPSHNKNKNPQHTSDDYLHLQSTNQNLVRKHQSKHHHQHHGSSGGGHLASSRATSRHQRTAAAAAAAKHAAVQQPPEQQRAAPPRARVNSIAASGEREATPTSLRPDTPSLRARSMSFCTDAPRQQQQQQPQQAKYEPCYLLNANGASYQIPTSDSGAYLAREHAPSLFSSSNCSSMVSSPASASGSSTSGHSDRSPASLENASPVASASACASSMLYDNSTNINLNVGDYNAGAFWQNQQQQQAQYAHGGYATTWAGNHCGGGGGGSVSVSASSSILSGGAGGRSTSDSMCMSINLEQYISKRNERERSRVRNVNDAFDNLKSILPLEVEKMSKRMSKVEILRSAIEYIRNMEQTLERSNITQQQQQLNGSGFYQQHQVSLHAPVGGQQCFVERAPHEASFAPLVRDSHRADCGSQIAAISNANLSSSSNNNNNSSFTDINNNDENFFFQDYSRAEVNQHQLQMQPYAQQQIMMSFD